MTSKCYYISLFSKMASLFYQNFENFSDDDEFDEEDDKEASKDRILQKIQQKKEIIQKLRGQPWYMRRKRRTLK